MSVDYARHARQVALPELGADGQRALAETPADLGALPPVARELHARAGGAVGDGGVAVEAPAVGEAASPALALGVAAWGCVEAARRVLAQPPRAMPDALVARLTHDAS